MKLSRASGDAKRRQRRRLERLVRRFYIAYHRMPAGGKKLTIAVAAVRPFCMLKVDHVHMVVSIPPKYSVAQVIGYVKGKSAIWVARATGKNRNFVGQNFWARGYCVSTIGLDEETIREYVRSQEEADKKLDQLRMFE